jgi:hypothetical protein
MKNNFTQFIRENIYRLLEEETKFQPGDVVETQKDGTGIVRLSKHPYYSVQLDSTGVTKTFHFNELQPSEPIESEFGKYEIDEIKVKKPQLDFETWKKMIISKTPSLVFDILKPYGFEGSTTLSGMFKQLTPQEAAKTYNEVSKLDDWLRESKSEDLIKFTGIIILKEDVWMTDVLSSIRSIEGITIVRNEDIETVEKNEKSRLHIKIDPYPFGSQSPQKIERIIISKILQIPGVKSFSKIKQEEEKPDVPIQTFNPTPVKSIEDLQENKIRIKIKDPK